MKLVAHASPSILEHELLDRVAAAKAGDPLAPVLIVVPSRGLADHLERRLVERFGAVLGITVLHHRTLAERILETAGAARLPVLGDDLLDALFSRVVDRAAPGPLRTFVREHPGAAAATLKTLTDLREAGIQPADLSAVLTGAEAETASLFALWSDALDELASRALAFDEAGLSRAASTHAAGFGARFALVLHHGAYDLIGVHVDVVRALDRGREVTFLLPADPEGESGAFGVARARAIAASSQGLSALDREVAPAESAFFHAQGASAELRTAAYHALAAVASGTPPHEVAIVVRSFGPYAAALDALLDGGGPGWHTSYKRPLRRDPQVARALVAIASIDPGDDRTWRAHADAFEAIANGLVTDAGLGQLFKSMREIETVLGDRRAVPLREAVAWLEARADAARRAPEGADGGGVRILDAMQARGMTFAHVTLAGMNTGIFPRIGREDPFLSDASRVLLREGTGRPLPVAAESPEEEHLLLAMTLRQAQRHLKVSWQRADDAAKPLVPSLALRDIARFTRVGAEAADVERDAEAIPAHPRSRFSAWAQEPGLLSGRDETLLTALASETGADARPALIARRPECGAGVAMLEATESFEPGSGRYDGRIGVPALGDSISASAFETLGRCPLQFFFRHVLRVEPPEPSPTDLPPDARKTGSRVHETLREVYARLLAERRFAGGPVDQRIDWAKAILQRVWRESAEAHDASRAAQYPLLERIEGRSWVETLGAFLDVDLRRLAAHELTPRHLEHKHQSEIPGGPAGVVVRARFDRVLSGPEGSIISDYKTGGNLENRIDTRKMLSGRELQVPLYALLTGSPVELLGVGPDHDPNEDVVRFEDFKTDEARQGFLETLDVLVELARSGRYPIRPGDHCEWCDYRSACRREHPPTRFREDRAADVKDARDCWAKQVKRPTLAAVRRAEAP